MAARETDPSISTDADRRVSGETASSILTIDLDALKRNYAFLRRASGTAETAAVVKADAYGLGSNGWGRPFGALAAGASSLPPRPRA